MPHTAHYSALLIGLLLLGGCTGNLSGIKSTQLPSTTVNAESTSTFIGTDSAAHTGGVSEPIAVVNNRSTPYRVRFYVVRESNPELNVTFGNGSTVTKSINESSPLVQGIPFVHRSTSSVERVRNISSIQPTNSDSVAEWSAIVQPESAVSLPRPIDRHNVTLLVVVKTTVEEQSVVYTAAMERCEPPRPELSEFRIFLQEDVNTLRFSSSCP